MTNAHLTEDLLIEIGCEELPPKNLKKIQDAFLADMTKALALAELTFKDIRGFSTPRRLALQITGLSKQQPTQLIKKRGPAKTAAFDEKGNPTKAALGFAESCGVPIQMLSLQETEKGAWLVFEQTVEGQSTEKLIPTLLTSVLNTLAVGRRMRWGNSENNFFRPMHWIVILFGKKIIEATLFDIKTSNVTYGHRFHHPNAISISNPTEYESLLFKKGFVMANFDKRREAIISQIDKVTHAQHCQAMLDLELLDEVTGLVEWPVILLGSFEKSFLEVPTEALISSMQTHQKCFPVVDKNQTLLPKFLIVSNIESKDPALVIAGNEWVMNARLADAAFYYRVDKEISLHQRREDLKKVRFQHNLGTLWDKTERISKLAKLIAGSINADPSMTERAALLCKSDLLTQMVGEFPELQGIMGRYYALHDKESEIVARAIEDHYHPRFAQDILPSTLEGSALAIADRIDSLVGLFGLGNRPTGDKDPFGLRRQALGLLRILVEKQFNLDLKFLFTVSKESYSSLPNLDVIQTLLDFCFERFRAWYQDKGIPTSVFEAVLAKNLTDPFDFDQRIKAVHFFTTLKEAESLAAANKRVQNILSKSDLFISPDSVVHTTLLKEEAEKTLWSVLSDKEKELAPLIQTKNYTDALKSLATLRDPVDQFFTHVMVMAEEKELRNNRLNLLNRLRILFLEIADISLL